MTLNRDDAIRDNRVVARFDYAHPVLDVGAIAAQQRHEELNGYRGTWFCGAYWGYGFHEDGVQSALHRMPTPGRRRAVTQQPGGLDHDAACPVAPTGVTLRSGIYEGTVVHHRYQPVKHRFSYPITMTLLDLAEVSAVCQRHPLWSDERANVVSFRRADYLGDPATPLDQSVRDLVEARTGRRPSGPVALLTQVRTWGWLFNPISVYYCFTSDGTEVATTVVEVTNPPGTSEPPTCCPGPAPIWWPSSSMCHPSSPWPSPTDS